MAITQRGGAAPDLHDPVLTAAERRPELWLVGSAVLGIFLDRVGIAATAFEWGVLLLGALIALVTRKISLIVAVMVYGAMCDVLWRSTAARAPWEGPKYLIVCMSAIALVRFAKHPKRLGVPLLFLVSLVPGVLITVSNESVATARDVVAFVLMGSAGLATATMLFRQLVLSREEMRGLMWIAVSPIVSVGAIATLATATAKDLEFGTEANFATSGGFGPNQIATVLGLGGLLCLVILLLGVRGRKQLIIAACGAWLIGQALITFARGGVYGFGIAAAAMLLAGLLLRGNRSRGVMVVVIGGLILLVVLNWAQSFSGGALDTRYDQNDSGRGEVASAELELFADNPLGVGAGRAKFERKTVGSDYDGVASHNEMTRLLAEHGYLGAIALALLVVMAVQAVRWSNGSTDRVVAVGFVVWSSATMFHSATRLAAVGLVFGLASLRLEPTRSELQSRVTLGLRHRRIGSADQPAPVVGDALK